MGASLLALAKSIYYRKWITIKNMLRGLNSTLSQICFTFLFFVAITYVSSSYRTVPEQCPQTSPRRFQGLKLIFLIH